MGKKKLTLRHQIFIKEYLIDKNATRAALAAGYSSENAARQGSRLLQNVLVKAEIAQNVACQSQKLSIKAEDILKELLRIATADISLAFDDMGQIKPFSEIPEDVRRAISNIEVFEKLNQEGDTVIGLTKKIKFWDKVKALEALGKHLKLFTEVHQIQAIQEPETEIPDNGR